MVSSKIVMEQKQRPLNILVLVVVQPLQFPMHRQVMLCARIL